MVESTRGDALVIDLTNSTYLDELIQANRIQTFDRNNASCSTLVKFFKKERAEADEELNVQKRMLEHVLKSVIFIKMVLLTAGTKDAKREFWTV